MAKIKSRIILLLLITCLTHANAKDRGVKRISDLSHHSGRVGRFTAVVIGIDDYADPNIPDLRTAADDAEAMAQTLTELYGFRNIRLLRNREATRGNIIAVFRKIAGQLGEHDNLLIYYAGHGELDRLIGDGWWIPADARAGRIETYLENTTIQKYLRAIKARHVLLISDSCFSGTLFGETRSLPPYINDQFYLDLYNLRSRWGMTSGNKTPVSDAGFGGHSAFSGPLINFLQSNRKPYITPREIYAAIGPVVRNNSEQMPICRPLKMTHDQGGEFVFIRSTGVISKPAKQEKGVMVRVITDNVTGAAVYLDGQRRGSTPVDLQNLKPGVHRIRLEKSGYEPYKRRVRVEPGGPYRMNVVLTPSPSRTESADSVNDPLKQNTNQTGPGVWLDKQRFIPGEEMAVYFSALPSFPDNAYVAIVHSGVMHGSEDAIRDHNIDYDEIEKRVRGTMKFKAPSAPGYYDARMCSTHPDGAEVASVPFIVGNPGKTPKLEGGPKVWLEKNAFAGGEEMAVHFTAKKSFPEDAYIAIVPSGVVHGSEEAIRDHNIDYDEIEKRVWGIMKFKAPSEPGYYDIRMCSTHPDGAEVTYTTFIVGNPPKPPKIGRPGIWLTKRKFYGGEEMAVRFTASKSFPEKAYIAIVPDGVPHGSEEVIYDHNIDYEYIERLLWGTLKFKAPRESGRYDLRMCSKKNGGREVASFSFIVY